MNHRLGENEGLRARLSTCRMTPTERLNAVAALSHGEALAGWLIGTADDFRAAAADLGRVLRRVVQSAAQFGSFLYDRR